MEEANKLVGAGKKYLVMGKVVEAVSALQEACDLLAKKYGDTADECGEAFFWCGKALLDLARMENSVLGNALEGVPEEDEDEEKPKDSNVESTKSIDEKTRDELRVQVYDAMAEKTEEKKNEAQEEKTESSEAADEQKQEKVEDEENCKEGKKKLETEEKENKSEPEEETPKDGESADKEEKEDNEEEEEGGDADAEMGDNPEELAEGDATAEKDSEDEEEVGNLQLAWEMLEVAKVIYKRRDTKEEQLMAAQTHLKLGEVSAESGNYSQAVEDFEECLRLQLKHLEPDSRLLAETHYQLGLAFSLDLQYRRAVEALNSSVSVIRSRLKNLQALLDGAEGPDALPDERKELEELKALLPEIQEKVEDAAEGLKTESAAAEAMKEVLDGSSSAFSASSVIGDSSSTSAVSSTTAPVSNISHLVRKKRKPDESPVKEADTKRAKQDDCQEPHPNGVHAADGASNGHAHNMEVST